MRFPVRATLLLLPLTAVVVLAGCPEGGPDLGDPPADCAQRPPPKVTIRAGQGEEDAGVRVAQGFQGGYHLWINVEAHDLGPRVLIEPAVHDAKTGDLLSEPDLQQVLELDRALDDSYDPVTVQGRITVQPESLFGKTVKLSAKVTDACPHEASGSLTGVVEEGIEDSY